MQALKDYGRHIGMAFQIVDDILDVLGSTDEIGKPVGHDLLQGVLTLPTIKLIERYPDDNPVKALFPRRQRGRPLGRSVGDDTELRHRGGVLRRGAGLLRQGQSRPESFGGRASAEASGGFGVLCDGADALTLPHHLPSNHRYHHFSPFYPRLA